MSIWIYLIWFLLIALEIFRNWSIILVKNRRPVYWWSNVIRIVVGLIFWLCTGVVAKPAADHYYAIPIMMAFTFWFVFDYGLNLVRKVKPFYYLNPNGSWVAQAQCKYPDAQPWFFFKLALALGAISLCQTGLNAVI